MFFHTNPNDYYNPKPLPFPIHKHTTMTKKHPASNVVPSARFLNPNLLLDITTAPALSDRGTSFVGAITGFLPPVPLSHLPPSHHCWQDAAEQLPATVRSGQWKAFVSRLPDLSVSSLGDCHLLRANMCLGAIAHALQNVACVDVPECVMAPWKIIAERLERPTASFNSLDWFIYNYDLITPRFVRATNSTVQATITSSTTTSTNLTQLSTTATQEYVCTGKSKPATTDAWLHTRPMFTVSGTMTETHFITGCHAIELAAASLPGIVASVQQAAHDDDDDVVFSGLCEVANVVEKMTTAFRSADMRPGSATYVDGVEWGRVIGVTGLAVVPGEKTISGLLFPSIHLLDVFLGRSMYGSQMGVLEETDRKWLPPLHRAFFDAVEKTSVMDYVVRRKDSHPRLMACFQHTVATFASETGFLGKHRLRIVGFLELSMKVGRPATAAGTKSAKWQRRMWRQINKAMVEGMHERLRNAGIPIVTDAGPVCRATVANVTPVSSKDKDNQEHDASVFQVVLNTDGRLLYSPGDHIGVMPQNSTALVDATLKALEMQPDETLVLQNKTWRTMMQTYFEYGGETGDNINNNSNNFNYASNDRNEQLSVTAQQFLSMATLQPFHIGLADRLIEAMFITDSALIRYLRTNTATNVAMALQFIRNAGCTIPPFNWRAKLDFVFDPLAPRYYSVSSHRTITPTSVELIVGRLQYRPSQWHLFSDKDEVMVSSMGYTAGLMRSTRRQSSISMPPLDTAYTKIVLHHNEMKELPSWSSFDSYSMPSSSSSSCSSENSVPSSNTDRRTIFDVNCFDDVSINIANDIDTSSNTSKGQQMNAHMKKFHGHTQALSTVTDDVEVDLPIYQTFQSHSESQVTLTPAPVDHQSYGPSEHMLEGISSSFLTRAQPGTTVPIFSVPELDFRLPDAVDDIPVVLISLGTGFAPFRSFLKELIARKEDGEGTRVNKAWLIMGVQSQVQIPFVNEIEEAICEHSVADVSIAFSREDIDLDKKQTEAKSKLTFRQGKRKRVQGLFEQSIDDNCDSKKVDDKEEDPSQRLWHVLRNGGHIFGCGKPDLEPLVRELVTITVRKCASASMIGARTHFDASHDLDSMAAEYADRMFAERRIHIDAYYSGPSTEPPLSTLITNISNVSKISNKNINNSSNVNHINKSNKNNKNNNLTYSYSDVARHHQATDCWVIFRNGVYDLTKYLAVHPGGPKLLLDKAGRDLTEDFDVAHGRNNTRVVSMLLPYHVGTMEKYTCGSLNSSKKSKLASMLQACIMDKWSVPLLHTVLEHRSVFQLDLNRFDSLREPSSHTAFKSQIDQPGGLASVVIDKFWVQYEPDLFEVLSNALGDDQLGAAVIALHRSYQNDAAPTSVIGSRDNEEEMMLELVTVRSSIKQLRNMRCQEHDQQTLSMEIYLERAVKFFDVIVATCLQLQETVEKALADASRQEIIEDISMLLLPKLVRKMRDGIESAYDGLSGHRLRLNEHYTDNVI